MLDTNLWSSLDDGSLSNFEVLLARYDLTINVLPSTLLEIVEIPSEEVRSRLIQGLCSGARRVRQRTEADMFGEEIIGLIRRTRPEWLLQIPNPALLARHRNYWLKKVWSNAQQDSTSMHEYQAKQKPLKQHVIDRQKYHRSELIRTGFKLGPLLDLVGRDEDFGPGVPRLMGSLPGWDGSPRAAWRLNLAQFTWHHLGIVGPRAAITGEDRTETDWVEPYVDLRKVRSDPDDFVRMWLDDAMVEDVPRTWLNWAVDVVQWTTRIGSGNPADAQHASYLVDCDLFLTADARFIDVLERVREDAPFTFARTVPVSGDRDHPTADRIEAALTGAL